MREIHPTWVKSVDAEKCHHARWVRNGRTVYGSQRLRCKDCGKCFVQQYSNKACLKTTNLQIAGLLKEGVGIRGTSRLLNISKTTVTKRILLIAATIKKPTPEPQQMYELDELRTYIGNKNNLAWIAYALDRSSRRVIDFNIGNRSNIMFKPVVRTLLASDPERIYTDKLVNYRYLLPSHLHRTKEHGINHIERMNLTLRTQLKRLGRRTICYSKNLAILIACMKIYFWA